MTLQLVQMVPGAFVPTSVSEMHTTEATGKITAAHVVNVSTQTLTLSVWIGGSATDAKAVVYQRRVDPAATLMLPDIVGHVLAAGDNIFAVVSVRNDPSGDASDALTMRVSGVVVSA